eukprot:jgi/Ulvmu1/4642/UM002_0373.1
MGQSKKNRSRKRAGKNAASASPAPAAAEGNTQITVDIHIGGIEFLEGSRKLDDSNGLTGGDAGPQGSIRYELASLSNKTKVVEWFKAGCDQDNSAEMWFNAALSKEQRKDLHTLCTSYPSLKSVSRGTQADRQIGIVHLSNSKWDIPPMCDSDEMKASALLSHLRDSGQPTSVDEVRGMIASQSLSAELEEFVNGVVKDQQDVNVLLDAVSATQSDTVRSLLSTAPRAVNIKQHRTGILPLHAAAAAGDLSIMGMLVGAGASLEQKDGKDRTALQAARAAEQCDAEGWLIQQGAQDLDAKSELTEAANIAALDSAAPAAAVLNRAAPDTQREEQAGLDINTVSNIAEEAGADPASQDAAAPATPEPEAGEADIVNSNDDLSSVQPSTATEPSLAPVMGSAPNELSRESSAGVSGAAVRNGSEAVSEAPDEAVQGPQRAKRSNLNCQSTLTEIPPESDMPKVNCVPEIEPAPPKPASRADDGAEYEMSIQQDEESGIDVLVAWAGNTVAAATDFCSRYPAVVATASAAIAVAGAVLIKLASGSRK